MTSENDPMRVFDRHLVKRHRDRAAGNLAAHDFLFMEGAERLCDRLLDIDRNFPLGVDLGCHGGEIAKSLPPGARVGTLFRTDLSEPMVRLAGGGIVCDEEWLPFRDGSLDLVISNLSLHWVNDLPGALAQIRRALKPDGLFLAAVFGGETLRELRDCLAAAEIEIDGGLSPRISPFTDVRDLGALLQRAGFALPVVDTDTLTVHYSEPMKLLADLRGMGESNAVLERRRQPLKRGMLMRAMSDYADNFIDGEGRIKATFEILTMTAWAPADTQQKPLRPGSASARLSEALGTAEISLGEKASPKR